MFHVGQMVVCVDDDWNEAQRHFADRFPHKGEVLTVRAVLSRPTYTGDGLLFEEITAAIGMASGLEWGFPVEYFRPVKTTSIDIFTAMLGPAPKQQVTA